MIAEDAAVRQHRFAGYPGDLGRLQTGIGGGATKDPGSSSLERMRSSSVSYLFYRLCAIARLPEEAAARLARRAFITKAARQCRTIPGATLRDVQAMAGHRSLDRLQHLLESDEQAQRRIVADLFRSPEE